MQTAKTAIAIAATFFALQLSAETRLSDAQIIEQIKVSDSVMRGAFVSCADERIVRKWHKDREAFFYSAKCTLREPEDACERQDVHASGDIEATLVTVYAIRLHLLCQD